MTANSFSTPTTLPLMTEPSCMFPLPNDSSSSLAKSSREGAVAVAMKSPEAVRRRVGMAFEGNGAEVPAELRRPPGIRMAGAKTVLSERWFDQARFRQRLKRGFVLQHEG